MDNNSYSDNNYTYLCSEKTLQSDKEGFFMKFAQQVAEDAGDNWIRNVFGKLKNDKERIRCIFEDTTIKESVGTFLENIQEIYRKKNGEISKSKVNEALNACKSGDKLKALGLYSQAIIRAPTAPTTGENRKFDDILALAFMGRAEILIELKKYNEALIDIQMALQKQLPNQFKFKAYSKMALCYKAMKKEDKYKISLELAKNFCTNDEELKTISEEAEKNTLISKSGFLNIPDEKKLQNKFDSNISNKLDVKFDKECGRYMVAKKTINTGEVLVKEEPYAACLLPEVFGTHCQNCFQRLLAPIPCPQCTAVAFCSPTCRDHSLYTFHRYECRFLDLLLGSGMSALAHCALRMITQTSPDFDRNTQRVYSLCTNSTKRNAKDFLNRTLMAGFLLRCLQKAGYIGESGGDTPTQDEYKIGEALLYNLQMLQFNAHEVYESVLNPENKCKISKMSPIGIAVYPTVALFNHSCYPAVIRSFIGKYIVIKAVRPLENGDLIAENYGPIFTRKSLVERQKMLTARYWFTCKCIACIQNWPSWHDGLQKTDKRVRCPTEKCEMLFTLPLPKETVTCPKCNKFVDLSENIRRIQWCTIQFEKSSKMIQANKIDEAEEILKDSIDIFHKISSPPSKELHDAEELLRTIVGVINGIVPEM